MCISYIYLSQCYNKYSEINQKFLGTAYIVQVLGKILVTRILMTLRYKRGKSKTTKNYLLVLFSVKLMA